MSTNTVKCYVYHARKAGHSRHVGLYILSTDHFQENLLNSSKT